MGRYEKRKITTPMKETELWELLVSLSANEISLAETHDRILRLERSEQLVCDKCNGWGYTSDENGRRKIRCTRCD
jgi:hypothetical protein